MSGLSFQNRGAFIGRTKELDVLAGALETSALVTLVGTGGVGKTRLAAEFLRERDDVFSVHAVWLDEIGTGSEIPARLVKAAGLSSTGEHDTERAIAALAHVKDTLVFFDNAEHVLEGVRAIVAQLIHHKIPVLAGQE